MVDYLNEGVTDEVAIQADMEAKQIPVTTADLTMALERLRAAPLRVAPPTVAQVDAAVKTAAAGAITPAAAAATPQPSPPINPAAQPTYPANTAGNAAKPAGVAAAGAAPPNQSAPNQGATPTPPSPPPTPQTPQKAPTPVIMPPEFQIPVAEIDDLIRQGYTNEAIEASMKTTHQQTYRTAVRRRIESDAELAEKEAAMERRLAAPPVNPAGAVANPAGVAAGNPAADTTANIPEKPPKHG